MRTTLSRTLITTVLIGSVFAVGLTACGGGGSNGGSGSTPVSPPPPPPPPPPSSSASEFPKKFEATFEENGSFQSFDTPAFLFTAPDSDLPKDLVLTGADAVPFTVALDISAPNTDGKREIVLRILTSEVFNFEDPKDANKDNIYQFQISGNYKGEKLSAAIKVTILDILDNNEAKAVVFSGESPSQNFGIPLIEVPDYTGDGKSEIGVSNQSGNGNTSAYILTSDFITANNLDNVTVGPAVDTGARFTTNTNSGSPTTNRLSSQKSASGNGVDILLSTAVNTSSGIQARLFVLPIKTATDVSAITGNINPATITNRIVYSLKDNDGTPQGTLIGDVNGDAINDIAVIFEGGVDGLGRAGIIFGRAGSNGVTNVSAGLDITFETAGEFFPEMLGNGIIDIQMTSDLDGDGSNDLILTQQQFGQNNVFFIKGAALTLANPVPFDLDNLDLTTQGFKLRNHEMFALSEGQDYDGDGIPTLFFSSRANDIFIVDGDDFAAINPATSTRLYGDTSITLTLEGGQFMSHAVMVNDLDGDGDLELMGASQFKQVVQLVGGDEIRKALAKPGTGTTLKSTDVFEINLSNFITGTFDLSDSLLYLKEQGIYAVPFGTTNSNETDSGKLLVFGEASLKTAYTSGAPGLTLTK